MRSQNAKLGIEEKQRAKKRLSLLMERLEGGAIFVEGKNDKKALESLGFTEVYTISGNMKSSCEKARANGVRKAVLLTDLDERGEELANETREELGRYGITCDTQVRKNIAGLLGFRCFENMKRKHDEFNEKIKG